MLQCMCVCGTPVSATVYSDVRVMVRLSITPVYVLHFIYNSMADYNTHTQRRYSIIKVDVSRSPPPSFLEHSVSAQNTLLFYLVCSNSSWNSGFTYTLTTEIRFGYIDIVLLFIAAVLGTSRRHGPSKAVGQQQPSQNYLYHNIFKSVFIHNRWITKYQLKLY